MPFPLGRVVPFAQEGDVAQSDSSRLAHHHGMERECIYLLLIEDARRGFADIEAGRTEEADRALAAIQARRAGRISDQP